MLKDITRVSSVGLMFKIPKNEVAEITSLITKAILELPIEIGVFEDSTYKVTEYVIGKDSVSSFSLSKGTRKDIVNVKFDFSELDMSPSALMVLNTVTNYLIGKNILFSLANLNIVIMTSELLSKLLAVNLRSSSNELSYDCKSLNKNVHELKSNKNPMSKFLVNFRPLANDSYNSKISLTLTSSWFRDNKFLFKNYFKTLTSIDVLKTMDYDKEVLIKNIDKIENPDSRANFIADITDNEGLSSVKLDMLYVGNVIRGIENITSEISPTRPYTGDSHYLESESLLGKQTLNEFLETTKLKG